MNKTFSLSLSLVTLALFGALGLSGCDKKPATPTPSTMESPSAAPMASGPASRAP